MNVRLTLACASRVLAQLRRDHRTVALVVVLPCVLIGLLAWVFEGTPVFDRIGAPLLGVFPFVVMFLVTSVATLRERRSGTLERLMTLPVHRADVVVGYASALGAAAVVQAVVASLFAHYVCGLDVRGPLWWLVVVAVCVALLGTTLGLAASSLARTEFQAVQLMPAVVLPQFLLCGLILPREDLPDALRVVSDVLPLSYAVDALTEVAARAQPWPGTGGELVVIAAFVVVALGLGAATLPRRTS